MEDFVHRETCQLPAAGSRTVDRLIHLLDVMQEAASRHAQLLGCGLRHLQAQELTWVLARQHTRILLPLQAGQRLEIATWPSGKKKLYAIRDFRVSNEAGAESARATSAWLMLSTSSRRPVRLEGRLPDFQPLPERILTDEFAPLPVLTIAEKSFLYAVQDSDIDLNQHVNNLTYLEQALRALPESISCDLPAALEIAFLAEAFAGDVLECQTQLGVEGAGHVFIQSLRRVGDGRELARLRSRWPRADSLFLAAGR